MYNACIIISFQILCALIDFTYFDSFGNLKFTFTIFSYQVITHEFKVYIINALSMTKVTMNILQRSWYHFTHFKNSRNKEVSN